MSKSSIAAKKAILKHTFPDLHEETVERLAQVARVRVYEPGIVLCQEGRHEDTFYIIVEGEVAISKMMGSEEHVLRKGTAGDFFGEMTLLDETLGRSASVTTTLKTAVIELDRPAFNLMVQRNPNLVLAIAKVIIHRMRENDRIALAELQAQNRETEEAYESLRRLDEQRHIFLTTLAHELRTPLTAVMGYMQLLRGGLMKGPALQLSLEKIGGGLDRMVSLINDLLFVQQIEIVEVHFRPLALDALLAELVEKYRPIAEHQKNTLHLQIVGNLPEMMGDAEGLRRCFGHLVDNAIKFSPEGGDIHVHAYAQGTVIEVRVIDHGVGISPEFMPRLFQLFERDEIYGKHLFGGAGLGMPIVKHIVDRHNGTITVESARGKGSAFLLRFPIDAKRASVEINVDDAWVDVAG